MNKTQFKFDKLNLGCGTDIKLGYVNLDKFKFKGVNVIWDVNKTPYPIKDDSFKEVIMYHILEHVDDVVKTMEEIYRISKNGALIKILLPYFSGLDYIKDPTHRHPFSAATFDFFEKGKLGQTNYSFDSMKFNFKIINRRIIFSNNKFLSFLNPLFNLNQKVYERFFAYIFPAQILQVELRVVK